MNNSIKELILKKMENSKIYITNDFLEFGTYDAIRQALSRLIREGKINKILPGIFIKPKFNKIINEYEEISINELANTYARKMNWNIYPAGDTALNILGLSTQVVNTYIFISNGPYKKINYKNIIIEFKHRNAREIAKFPYLLSLLIQAIKEIGIERITEQDINILKNKLSNKEKIEILKYVNKINISLNGVIRRICMKDEYV